MSRAFFFLYGVLVYMVFFATFLYLVGFVENAYVHVYGHVDFVPKAIDSAAPPNSSGVPLAFVVDVALVALFAVQHSGMARRGFKAFWTRVLVPKPVERATYVLFTCACLIALFAFWRPLPGVVWDAGGTLLGKGLLGLSFFGWGLAVVSTFLIDHFDLFGLRQVYVHARGARPGATTFKVRGLYKLVRHPLYVGFLVAFWCAPVMSYGHLLFSVAMLGYILAAIPLEERDLVGEFGDEYASYRKRVRALVPLPRGR
jgi:protein-S-isoprenylcysteine O-methyltransferase Ste14